MDVFFSGIDKRGVRFDSLVAGEAFSQYSEHHGRDVLYLKVTGDIGGAIILESGKHVLFSSDAMVDPRFSAAVHVGPITMERT